jgi:hypothetical protein
MPILDDLGLSGVPSGLDGGIIDSFEPTTSMAQPNPQQAQRDPEAEAEAQSQAQAAQIQSQYASKISTILGSLNQGTDVDAYFYDPKTDKIILTRDYIEMILQEYGQATQNMSFLQKFVQIDSKLDKSLREYRVDIQSLLNSIIIAPQG